MKKTLNYFVVTLLTYLSISVTVNGQENIKVIGTVGDKNPQSDRMVICELGTQACMPVGIDTNMTTIYKGKETGLKELPFGLYLEVELSNENVIRNISVDETKTVICFTKLSNEKEGKLFGLLNKTDGIKKFKTYPESKQVYIEFHPDIISYKDIEDLIKKEGFELE
jgi:hypothetical protein